MRATLSLIGLYKAKPDLFTGLSLPDPITATWTDYDTGETVTETYRLQREVIIENILAEAGELEVLYPDPDFCYNAIMQWSQLHLPLWTRIWKDLCTHYFFQYNKDGVTDVTYGYEGRKDTERYGDVTGDFVTTTAVKREISVTTTGNRWGFNSENAVPVSEMTETPGVGTDTEATSTRGTHSREMAGKETERRHEYGNIGVTMSSQILRDELNVRTEFELPEMIKNQFIERFCLLIY